ncbi:MAG: type II toxin-antitoxin system death-on-curing family toxin [Clostridia bacterium]|nr:type II toxin-antitoxin system death-on-curing family toxin [Clostridia bacterium]
MILLTAEEVIALHEKLIEKTGGTHGIRDFGLLSSALHSAEESFGDVERYPTAEEKAARLLFALTGNHAFVDGNKRIGVLVMLLTLELNDIKLSFSQEELIDLGLSVAAGKAKYDEILTFIHGHKA